MTIITFKDKSVNNPLFSGVEKAGIATSFNMNSTNLIKDTTKTNQPTYISSDGVDTKKFLRAYNRKKSSVQFGASQSPTITINLLFVNNERDITTRKINGVDYSMLSINDVIHMIRTPKTYYMKVSNLIDELSSGDYPYYSSYGIPIVIQSWTLTINPKNNDVTFTLTCKEDIDEYYNV